MNKKTILLTGASGYLGGNLLKSLVSSNYKAIIIVRKKSDLSSISEIGNKVKIYYPEDIEKLFLENTVTIIIHLATNYGKGNSSLNSIYEANFMFPLTLLQYALKYKVQTFINTDTSLPAKTNSYAYSKKQFLGLLKFEQQNLQIINVALAYFYGPGDGPQKFITFIADQLISDVPAIALSEGTQVRDFIHIRDVLSAYILIISRINQLPPYINIPLGSGKGISLRNVVKKIKHITENEGTKLDFGALAMRPNEVKRSISNITFLKSLGWTPAVSIDSGLKELINDIKSRRSIN